MSDIPGPNREDATPDAAIVHLSGQRRGATEFLSGDALAIITVADLEAIRNDIQELRETETRIDEPEPFDVSLIAASDSADVAVLRCQNVAAGRFALRLDGTALEAGDEVVVLGYPTGIRAMIARSQREILPVLETRGKVDFWEVARILAKGGHIAALATRGIVGPSPAKT